MLWPIKESSLDFVIRAQLTTSDNRTDTYFARYQGQDMFVKGPYRGDGYKITVFLSQLKAMITTLPVIPLTFVKMIPDMFDDVPLGVRRHIDNSIQQPFVIASSLIPIDDLPTKQHSSKVWPSTEVVDWSKTDTRLTLPRDLKGYVNQLVWRKVMGIPDISMRNFMVVRDDRTGSYVYSVDEEGCGHNTNYANALGTSRDMVREYIDNHYNTLVKMLKSWQHKLPKYRDGIDNNLPDNMYSYITDMIDTMLKNKKNMLSLF